MNQIFAGDHYTNVVTGSIVEVREVDKEAEQVTVVTIAADGRKINQRTLKAASLRNSATNAKGAPYLAGYVRSDLLRTEAAPIKEPTVDLSDIDYTELDDMALAAFAARADADAKRLTELVEGAKKEMRRRTSSAGTRVFGDVAVNAAANNRFDATLAKANLTGRQYEAICVSKPDATLAKKILGENSPAYRATLKPGDWRITVRFATDEDREEARIAEQRASLGTFQPGDTLDGKIPF
jgi:hypothetical protein